MSTQAKTPPQPQPKQMRRMVQANTSIGTLWPPVSPCLKTCVNNSTEGPDPAPDTHEQATHIMHPRPLRTPAPPHTPRFASVAVPECNFCVNTRLLYTPPDKQPGAAPAVAGPWVSRETLSRKPTGTRQQLGCSNPSCHRALLHCPHNAGFEKTFVQMLNEPPIQASQRGQALAAPKRMEDTSL